MRKCLDSKSEQLDNAVREGQTLAQINKESAGIIKRLEDQVLDLEAENEALTSKEKIETSTQTEPRKE